MAEPKHTIHIRIRDLRRERSLTQEELADALGLSRQSINAMEAGRCLPSLPVALQIASYFSVPLGTVFEFPELQEVYSQVKGAAEGGQITALIPWRPLQDMRQALDELMDDSSPEEPSEPAVNVWQDDASLIVEAVVPGYAIEDIDLEIGDDQLTVSGEMAEPAQERRFIRQEFPDRSFRRVLPLPIPVEGGRAEATLRYGILTVTIPKLVDERPKTAKIRITSAE